LYRQSGAERRGNQVSGSENAVLEPLEMGPELAGGSR
jgi:hypothetical protein